MNPSLSQNRKASKKLGAGWTVYHSLPEHLILFQNSKRSAVFHNGGANLIGEFLAVGIAFGECGVMGVG